MSTARDCKPVQAAARGDSARESAAATQMRDDQKLDTTVPESFVASPAFLTASLTGFALLALDVFGPSAHLLSSVDNGAHTVGLYAFSA